MKISTFGFRCGSPIGVCEYKYIYMFMSMYFFLSFGE